MSSAVIEVLFFFFLFLLHVNRYGYYLYDLRHEKSVSSLRSGFITKRKYQSNIFYYNCAAGENATGRHYIQMRKDLPNWVRPLSAFVCCWKCGHF